MSKLLRSDFYRLFKSKSLYICTAVVSVFVILNIIIITKASQATGDLGEAYSSYLPAGGLEYAMSIFHGNLTTMISIVVAIFVTAEFAYGTMKNVVTKGFSKILIYLSRLITMIVAAFFMIFVNFLVSVISGTIAIGKTGNFSADMAKAIGVELLLYVALTAIFVFIAMLVRSLGGVIAINIIGVLSVGPLLFSLLTYLVKNKIDFSKFSLINNISYYPSSELTGTDYLRSIAVAVVYIVITVALGIYVFEKSDIK